MELVVRVDDVGNMFARRAGRDSFAAPVLTGSHLGSVGGKFDGSLGVIGGLEALKILEDAAVETDGPVEVVVRTSEQRSPVRTGDAREWRTGRELRPRVGV